MRVNVLYRLAGVASSVCIRYPAAGKDAFDHFEAGFDIGDFVEPDAATSGDEGDRWGIPTSLTILACCRRSRSTYCPNGVRLRRAPRRIHADTDRPSRQSRARRPRGRVRWSRQSHRDVRHGPNTRTCFSWLDGIRRTENRRYSKRSCVRSVRSNLTRSTPPPLRSNAAFSKSRKRKWKRSGYAWAAKESDATEQAKLDKEAIDAANKADSIEVPIPPACLAVDDVTPEQLEVLMSLHRGTIAVR